jgi:hypothetical protein
VIEASSMLHCFLISFREHSKRSVIRFFPLLYSIAMIVTTRKPHHLLIDRSLWRDCSIIEGNLYGRGCKMYVKMEQ